MPPLTYLHIYYLISAYFLHDRFTFDTLTMYYSKDLKMLSINHALFSKMNAEDWKVVENQMREDLNNYYQNI